MSALTAEERKALIDIANEARRRAYAPYSKYQVGAALRTRSGRIFTGCNVENAAYPSSLCAERVAIFKAVSAGERTIKAVLVYADTAKPTPPCGACLQVISEFAEDAEIALSNGRSTKTYRLRRLLPYGFRL